MVIELIDNYDRTGLNFIFILFYLKHLSVRPPTGPMYLVFCRLYTYFPSHHGSVWVLPVISLLWYGPQGAAPPPFL